QLRYTPEGTPVCDITLAINRVYKKSTGEFQKETCFIDIETWRKNAEIVAEHLKKGDPLLIVGSLKQDEWVDREGNKRSKIKIVAEKAQPLLRIASGGEVSEPSVEVPDE
ncbi:MAG: single-stranded DNA-binding protein, partial [Planctomycetota bacterium]